MSSMNDLRTSCADEAKHPKKIDDIEHSEILVPPSPKEEASLRRKFDVFLLPPLALMLVI